MGDADWLAKLIPNGTSYSPDWKRKSCTDIHIMDIQTISILGIIFISTFIASTLGFGLGLIGMPLLALIIDIKTATPLIAIVILYMSTFIIIQSRKELEFRNIWKLVVGSALGIPIGLFLLKGAGDSIMKIILALMIVLFALYSLIGRIRMTMKVEWPSYLFGLMAGTIGAAYNMGGPPVIVYGVLKKWPPSIFRATIFSFCLPLSILVVSSHWMTGLITESILQYSLLSLPITAFSTVVGRRLNRTIPIERFNRIIHFCLLLIGFSLLIKVIRQAP